MQPLQLELAHTDHGHLTPTEFTARWTTNNQPQDA